MNELNDRSPHEPTAKELREFERNSWNRIPQYDYTPSGRLEIKVLTGPAIQQDKFGDTKRQAMEQRLPQVLLELELRAAGMEEARLRRERAEKERQVRYEEALVRACMAALDAYRIEVLWEEVNRARRLKQLDVFISEAEAASVEMSDAERREADEWLDWVRDYRDRADPVRSELRLPSEPDFTSEELNSRLTSP